MKRLRAVDPAAALELEMSLVHDEGDLSRVIELEVALKATSGPCSRAPQRWTLHESLNELGYVREALLIGEAQPFERQTIFANCRIAPPSSPKRASLSEYAKEAWFLWPLIIELARSERYADLVALYERPGSALGRLRSIEDGNRDYRAKGAPFLAQALAKSGRSREAAQIIWAADEAIRADDRPR